jgi:hypothetical protein
MFIAVGIGASLWSKAACCLLLSPSLTRTQHIIHGLGVLLGGSGRTSGHGFIHPKDTFSHDKKRGHYHWWNPVLLHPGIDGNHRSQLPGIMRAVGSFESQGGHAFPGEGLDFGGGAFAYDPTNGLESQGDIWRTKQ